MKVLASLFFTLLLCLSVQGKPQSKASEKRVVCVFASWAGYRNGKGTFTPENTDVSICTHATYAFAGLDASSAQVVPLDPWNDLSTGGGKGFYDRFVALKRKNPSLKVLLAVGGWNEGSTKYSTMASNKSGRTRFINSAISLLKEHNFDGMEFDWMYPGSRGGAAADKENYALLLSEMRAAFDAENLMLTATLPALQVFVDAGYDIDAVVKNMDFVNILSYDYRGNWDRLTGLAAPLHFEDNQIPDVSETMKMYISKGVPSDMIVMGIPGYAQTLNLADPNLNGLGAPATGPGASGSLTQQPGFMGFNEVCQSQKESPDLWVVQRDEGSSAPYAANWLLWASYDDVVSVEAKANYIKENNLGGAMLFTIDTDDFRGECGTAFPLVRALYDSLMN